LGILFLYEPLDCAARRPELCTITVASDTLAGPAPFQL
jgi:hypothetical protein